MSVLNSLSKFIFVYMRGVPALILGGISLLTTEISPWGGGGGGGGAGNSKLRTHDKVCLDQHFFG